MKKATIEKYYNIANDIEESGLSIRVYCNQNDLDYKATLKGLNNSSEEDDKIKEILSRIKRSCDNKEVQDTDSRNECTIDRDETGKICGYSYKIYRKNRAPLVGTLDREQMYLIHRLYSYYGANVTQRQITRNFPELSLVDFKRILTAFGIYKSSAQFPPHMIEEYSLDELREIELREKENDFLKKAEEDRIKNNEKLLRKYAAENIELKAKLSDLSNIGLKIEVDQEPIRFTSGQSSDISLNLFIADMHIGAKVNSNSIYKENLNYGEEEVKRRLSAVLDNINNFGHLNHLRISLLGDNVDCCGVEGFTSRLDHQMPENMSPFEQGKTFISVMLWFINQIVVNNMANHVSIITVPCGNHTGDFEKTINNSLLMLIRTQYPDVETEFFDTYYCPNVFCGHLYICMHGKDDRFMKRPMPLHLDDKTRSMIYEYLNDNGLQIYNNIHVIKGDLHSEALDSCKIFDYRNVLSLFGASDYSSYNYSRNSWGVSYDLFIGDNLVRGSFKDL